MKGRLYNSDEVQEHLIDIQHKFHDTVESFETYECPDCKGHFLVESEAVESVSVMWCPYCKTEFEDRKVE